MLRVEAFSIRLAGKVFEVRAQFPETKAFCGEYLCSDEADFSVDITQEDIVHEREKAARQDMKEFGKALQHSDLYLETLALYRKIAGRLAEHQTLLVHGSAIAVDGQGYLFTAKSGTGKSTHTRLWRELLGERAVMINDDKPLITIGENGAYIHGTPWCGKHGLHTNLSVPLRAICILERGEQDTIEPVSSDAALPVLLQQTYRPKDMVQLGQVLTAVGMLAQSVKLYRLHCTMNLDAAQVAYAAMVQN